MTQTQMFLSAQTVKLIPLRSGTLYLKTETACGQVPADAVPALLNALRVLGELSAEAHGGVSLGCDNAGLTLHMGGSVQTLTLTPGERARLAAGIEQVTRHAPQAVTA